MGLHANWRRNETYIRKLSEAGVPIGGENFLGITSSYFEEALSIANELIQKLQPTLPRPISMIVTVPRLHPRVTTDFGAQYSRGESIWR